MRVFAGESHLAATTPDVDIGVIYTYERHLVPRLLSSLGPSAAGLRQRLILIDNDSNDGVGQWLRHAPDTKVLRNAKRLSYSANLNRILQTSAGRYVLMLNTDMFFDPQEQCISKMVRFMDEHPDCGIAGCRLYHEDGRHAPSARRFQTIPTILARKLGLGALMRRTLGSYFYREHAIRDCWECDWLSGCFMMIRREAFEQVGYFDVGFSKYFEDVDMCLRMARAGWRVMYNGATYCYHLEQRASKNLLSADARKHARSYLRWLLKWGFSPYRAVAERREPAIGKAADEPSRRRAA
ncbi:MAG: glycosyltransferase family 2 protein [Pirellulales bacterium]|nr:glycosyltransferase family 2 protein [Pirellulales bacterium]